MTTNSPRQDMRILRLLLGAWASLFLVAAGGARAAETMPSIEVASPDGLVVLRIRGDARQFSIARRGEAVVAASALGLELADHPLGEVALEARSDSLVDETFPLVATKASSARNHYRGATLVFREAGGEGRRLLMDVRAYDDGVAFRYRLDGPAPVSVLGERTTFVPAGDPSCLAAPARDSHETSFERLKISQMRADIGYDLPVVCATPSGRTHYAVLQADLKGYAGASLWREGDALRVKLSGVPGRIGAAVVAPSGLSTAWRVVMMGDRAGDLIASELIGNLNPPPQGDFGWVRPGKAAWDWWSGPLEGMKPDMQAYRRFIDFAAAAGLRYYLIDAGWASGPRSSCCEALPTTDITQAAQGIDMPALARYAQDKGVGLILWAHWAHVAPRMEQVLDTYARWGIRGVKIDFMNRDDQEIVAFYERVAAETAKRHMLLDLHGAYVPAGLERTFPNFVTQEGVLGAEWNKMNRDVTPRHNLMLPYTRMLAGPMDYTPGGMRNGTPASFEVRAVMPMTQTTRGQALAMYVVYDSPLQMVSDDPKAYGGAQGFDFIRGVPTAWDETRFLDGEPGRDIVLARRSGSAWFLGAMTSDEPRQERVALKFLPPGRYRATVWEDGAAPDEVSRTQRIVSSADVLQLRLALAGGAVVRLERLDNR